MKIAIGEFGNVYFIKVERPITEEQLRKLPEVVKLLNGRSADVKLDNHAMWIVKIVL